MLFRGCCCLFSWQNTDRNLNLLTNHFLQKPDPWTRREIHPKPFLPILQFSNEKILGALRTAFYIFFNGYSSIKLT